VRSEPRSRPRGSASPVRASSAFKHGLQSAPFPGWLRLLVRRLPSVEACMRAIVSLHRAAEKKDEAFASMRWRECKRNTAAARGKSNGTRQRRQSTKACQIGSHC
jgi:hypothetical protein